MHCRVVHIPSTFLIVDIPAAELVDLARLTHFSQIHLPTIISRTGPFPVLGIHYIVS